MVQVVNDLIGEPDMPSKDQIVNQLMDGVVLMANANIVKSEAWRGSKAWAPPSHRYNN